jgi:hypothetical protein
LYSDIVQFASPAKFSLLERLAEWYQLSPQEQIPSQRMRLFSQEQERMLQGSVFVFSKLLAMRCDRNVQRLFSSSSLRRFPKDLLRMVGELFV